MKIKFTFMLIFLSMLSLTAQTSTNEAAARQWISDHSKELKIKPTDNFKLSFVRKSISGETLRFKQMVNDVPVINSEIVLHFNTNNEITSATNTYVDKDVNLSTVPSITTDQAIIIAQKELKIITEVNLQKVDLVINSTLPAAKLIYRVYSQSNEGIGSWEVNIDAQTGAVISTRDAAIKEKKNVSAVKPLQKKAKKKVENSITKTTNASFVSGTALIFNPDPLSVAQTTYAGNYKDNNDATNASLDAARSSVTLPEIELTSGTYKLKSSFVSIKDIESPSKGLFTQTTNNFSFNRNQDGFEAVNAFYHLDNSMRYINNTLGIPCKPSLNSGIFNYDPSAANGDDNSYYLPASEQICFGEGGVDDAEDADVVLHEFGHGIHDWITNGSVPGDYNGDIDDGLGEGNGDYWAQSYSRSLNQWPTTNSAYQSVFNWDGPVWGSTRNTGFDLNYPDGILMQDNHEDGQIWSTAMMLIWDALGRVKTDKAFLEGLANTTHLSNQQDAAIAVRQAAIDMNYTCADIQTITTKFQSKGYTLPSLPLSMAAIANQTVTAGANNTYTLPTYATLANPISVGCTATLTQSPTIGTVLVPGVYTITMTATLNSTTITRTFTLTVVSNLENDTYQKQNVSIFPNPAKNQITILGNFDADESLVIYNLMGQKVAEYYNITNEQKFDIASLSEGLYTILFRKSNVKHKFIKQ